MVRNSHQPLIDTTTAHLNGEVQVRMVFNTLREITGRVLELKAANKAKRLIGKHSRLHLRSSMAN